MYRIVNINGKLYLDIINMVDSAFCIELRHTTAILSSLSVQLQKGRFELSFSLRCIKYLFVRSLID